MEKSCPLSYSFPLSILMTLWTFRGLEEGLPHRQAGTLLGTVLSPGDSHPSPQQKLHRPCAVSGPVFTAKALEARS